MDRMFYYAAAFDKPLDDIDKSDDIRIFGWDTSSVRSMTSMFAGASACNNDLLFWDTSRVVNMKSV